LVGQNVVSIGGKPWMVGREIEEVLNEMEKEYKYPLKYVEWFEALKKGKLLGLKCEDCGRVTCPPFSVCQKCGSKKLKPIELNGKGEIMTFTVIHTAPEGFNPPYIVCYVKMNEGPWIPGRLDLNVEAAEKEGVKLLGRKVELKGGAILPGDRHTGNVERVVPLFKLAE